MLSPTLYGHYQWSFRDDRYSHADWESVRKTLAHIHRIVPARTSDEQFLGQLSVFDLLVDELRIGRWLVVDLHPSHLLSQCSHSN